MSSKKNVVLILTKGEYKIIKKSLNMYAHKYPPNWDIKNKATQILKDISKFKK